MIKCCVYCVNVPHPFDRYAPFTDIAKLKEASLKPLRRSLRVNLLKSSVEEFLKWAQGREWKLEGVPWCKEGFFVRLDTPSRVAPSIQSCTFEEVAGSLGMTRLGARDNTAQHIEGRHDVMEEAFGRDLLHQLGATYIQEAASMLPVALLDPQPGETILDLCAAPGSKTTQIASAMTPHPTLSRGEREKGVMGVLVANDMQEKRLWVLKQSLHRCGVTNVIVTKKVGQWFGSHMTERFDRVLCDAPCTAQGIVRKDPSALDYSSPERVQKMARTQMQLLKSAVHATKVGGRIVYSTCTLTPEENEMVIAAILEQFQGKVEVVNPCEVVGIRCQVLGKAKEDSELVQKYLQSSGQLPNANSQLPLLRLWPHTFDTEGFFCAVLRKTSRTLTPTLTQHTPFQEQPLKDAEQRHIARKLEEQYGTSFLLENDHLFARGDNLLLCTDAVASFPFPTLNYSLGLPFAKGLKDGTLRITHELATLRGGSATKNICELSDTQLRTILDGKDTSCSDDLSGDVILRFQTFNVGMGFARDGKLKNRLPRWFVQQSM